MVDRVVGTLYYFTQWLENWPLVFKGLKWLSMVGSKSEHWALSPTTATYLRRDPRIPIHVMSSSVTELILGVFEVLLTT